jgi:hypothetical protein
MRRQRIAALALLITGCAIGPRVENFKPALQPAGIDAAMRLDTRASLRAELLDVQETGLVVLNGRKVTLIPYTSILSTTFPQTSIRIEARTAPSTRTREQLRLLSRFPQGLTPALLNLLLAAYQQEKLIVWPE